MLQPTGKGRIPGLPVVESSAGHTLSALPWPPLPLHLLLLGHHVRAALLAGQTLDGVGAAWPGAGPPATSGADQALGGVTAGDSPGESA